MTELSGADLYHQLQSRSDAVQRRDLFDLVVSSQCQHLLRDRHYPSALAELPEEMPSAQPPPADLLEQEEMRQRLRAAVTALPDAEQTPVALRYFDAQSQREIADQMNLSLAAVKNAWSAVAAASQKGCRKWPRTIARSPNTIHRR